MTQSIDLTINGTNYTHAVEPRLLLIHYLREVVGLTGPHVGCEQEGHGRQSPAKSTPEYPAADNAAI